MKRGTRKPVRKRTEKRRQPWKKKSSAWMQGAPRIASGDKLGEISMLDHPPEDTNQWWLNKALKISVGVRVTGPQLILGSDSVLTPGCPSMPKIQQALKSLGLWDDYILTHTDADWAYGYKKGTPLRLMEVPYKLAVMGVTSEGFLILTYEPPCDHLEHRMKGDKALCVQCKAPIYLGVDYAAVNVRNLSFMQGFLQAGTYTNVFGGGTCVPGTEVEGFIYPDQKPLRAT